MNINKQNIKIILDTEELTIGQKIEDLFIMPYTKRIENIFLIEKLKEYYIFGILEKENFIINIVNKNFYTKYKIIIDFDFFEVENNSIKIFGPILSIDKIQFKITYITIKPLTCKKNLHEKINNIEIYKKLLK